jgi:F-type H+-transporting ATPase subunit delta
MYLRLQSIYKSTDVYAVPPQVPNQVRTVLPLRPILILLLDSVQVNIPAESGEMGILANHVPSIEQLKPGLIEIIEESGGSKQFFCSYIIPRFC